MKIKVVIIDDEKHALITLQHYLEHIEGIEVLSTVQDSRLAKSEIEFWEPDLVFIDIQMPFLSGLEVLQQFKQPKFKAVFTTAYDQYAIQALRLNAFDYLLKPLVVEDLERTIEQFKNQRQITSDAQIAALDQVLVRQTLETIALSTQKGLIFVPLAEITYFSAESAYTFVHLKDGNSHLVSKTLSNFEEVLQGIPSFFRCHKSCMINLKFIRQYIRGEGGEIVMHDGKVFPLSRAKKQEFLQLFTKI